MTKRRMQRISDLMMQEVINFGGCLFTRFQLLKELQARAFSMQDIDLYVFSPGLIGDIDLANSFNETTNKKGLSRTQPRPDSRRLNTSVIECPYHYCHVTTDRLNKKGLYNRPLEIGNASRRSLFTFIDNNLLDGDTQTLSQSGKDIWTRNVVNIMLHFCDGSSRYTSSSRQTLNGIPSPLAPVPQLVLQVPLVFHTRPPVDFFAHNNKTKVKEKQHILLLFYYYEQRCTQALCNAPAQHCKNQHSKRFVDSGTQRGAHGSGFDNPENSRNKERRKRARNLLDKALSFVGCATQKYPECGYYQTLNKEGRDTSKKDWQNGLVARRGRNSRASQISRMEPVSKNKKGERISLCSEVEDGSNLPGSTSKSARTDKRKSFGEDRGCVRVANIFSVTARSAPIDCTRFSAKREMLSPHAYSLILRLACLASSVHMDEIWQGVASEVIR